MLRPISLIVLFIAISSCNKGNDCDNEYYPQKLGIYYGDFALSDSNSNWLAIQNSKTEIVFVNDSGFELPCSISHNSFRKDERLRSYEDSKTPCEDYIYDSYTWYGQTLSYSPLFFGGEISFGRINEFDWELNNYDSFTLKRKAEIFSLFDYRWNGNTDYFGSDYIIDTLIENLNQKYHSKLTVHSKDYFGVFEFINSNENLSNKRIKGYYFKINEGLIGFHLKNGETWMKLK